MTDDPHNRPGDDDPQGGQPGDARDLDDQSILDRLRALTPGGSDSGPARSGGPEHVSNSRRAAPAVQRHTAAVHRHGPSVARIVAPAVFLVAVIVMVALMFQSGLIGGDTPVAVSSSSPPSPVATKSGAAGSANQSATKAYVVKSGDTLSGIAVKFNTSVTVLEQLNPDVESSTLVVGAKIKVPNK
jgi:LysM repeat protein